MIFELKFEGVVWEKNVPEQRQHMKGPVVKGTVALQAPKGEGAWNPEAGSSGEVGKPAR